MTEFTEELLSKEHAEAVKLVLAASKSADGKNDPNAKKVVVQELTNNENCVQHLVNQFRSLTINTTNSKAGLIGDTLGFFAISDQSSLSIFDKLLDGLNLVKNDRAGLIASKLSDVVSTSNVMVFQHLSKLLPFMSTELGDRALALVQQEGLLVQANYAAHTGFDEPKAIAYFNDTLWSKASDTAHEKFDENKAIAHFNQSLWSRVNATVRKDFDKVKAVAHFNETLWAQANVTAHEGFNETAAIAYFNQSLWSRVNATVRKGFDRVKAVAYFNETLWAQANVTAHEGFNETAAIAYFNQSLWSKANATAHEGFDMTKATESFKKNAVDYKATPLYQAAFHKDAHKDLEEYLAGVRSAAPGSDADVKKFVVATLIEVAAIDASYESLPTLKVNKEESSCVKFGNGAKGLDLDCTTSNCVISRDVKDFSMCVAKSASLRSMHALAISAIEVIDDASNNCIGVVVLPSE